MSTTNPDRRPPLVPLDTTAEMAPTIRLGAQDDVSALHHDALFDFGGDNEFELMHVTITLHGLTGITAEKSLKKKKGFARRSSFAHRSRNSTKTDATNPDVSVTSVASSVTSTDVSSSLESANKKAPTTAIVSFSRNVSNSDTKIYTHLPSIPIGFPSSSYGKASRYLASWPEAPSPLLNPMQEEYATASSFTFLRVMMREPIVPGGRRDYSTMSTYVHQTIDMRVNLARGKELIALGTASIAISGDEESAVMTSVPVKPVKTRERNLASTPDSLSKHFFKRNGKKRSSFPSEPLVRYNIDDNSTLRVTVQVMPHQALMDAEERKKAKEIHFRRLQERAKEESLIAQRLATCSPRFVLKKGPKEEIDQDENDPRTSFFQIFACGHACSMSNEEKEFAPSKHLTPSLADDASSFDESEILDSDSESHHSSMVSSVSESESDSESEDGSRGDRFLYKKIVIRKKVL